MSLEIKDRDSIVSIAVDSSRNAEVSKTYSKDETQTALRNALIEANNGKTYFDIRDIRDGNCRGLFSIIETIIKETEDDLLVENPLWKEIVEYKNIGFGDANSFYIPDDSYLYVSKVNNGSAGVVRQRVSGGKNLSVNTDAYEVKVYDDLIRVLAGRSSLDEFIKKCSQSLSRKKIELILQAFLGITTSNPNNIFLATSTGYVENTLFDLCLKVEAKNGVMPTIIGTKKALRNITLDATTLAEQGKNDLYNMGYYGKFNGYNCVHIPNVLKKDNTNYYLPDDTLYVIGTLENKPVKFVTEGSPLVFVSEANKNIDLTQDFMTIERFGCAVALAGKKNGVYKIS